MTSAIETQASPVLNTAPDWSSDKTTISYSRDQPNNELGPFVLSHPATSNHDPCTDRYKTNELIRSINTTKNSPVYAMHSYHLGKKPVDAVQEYIRHYTSAGDLVLDPFCGSGSTALACLLEGRKAIAIDASPAATFISRFYLARSDPEDLERRFKRMMEAVKSEEDNLYRTTCHLCGEEAVIHYVIYSNEYDCPVCGKRVSLFEASQFDPPGCPRCKALDGVDVAISPKLPVAGISPVAVNFSCQGRSCPKRQLRSILGTDLDRNAFERIDLPRIRELEAEGIPYPFPRQRMMNVNDPTAPWGDEWRPSRNFRRVRDLFTHRNLRALAALFHAAGNDDDLRAVITSVIPAVSRKAQHLDRGGGYIPGNWALPPMSKQRNVMESLRRVFGKTLKAKRILSKTLVSQDALISTQSAASLDAIPSSSIDYIFTDPPYGGAVQYAELNFVWEAWLGFGADWHEHEIIVNQTRGKDESYWADRMREAMAECFRVLKPGRWLSLCYHDAAGSMWGRVQRLMADVGFELGTAPQAVTIDTGANTYNQRVTDKLVKRDLVISFRKPRARPAAGAPLTSIVKSVEPAHSPEQIIKDYLRSNPGAQRSRIYDHFVNTLMRTSSIQEFDFDASLQRVAQRSETDAAGWVLIEDEGSTPPAR